VIFSVHSDSSRGLLPVCGSYLALADSRIETAKSFHGWHQVVINIAPVALKPQHRAVPLHQALDQGLPSLNTSFFLKKGWEGLFQFAKLMKTG